MRSIFFPILFAFVLISCEEKLETAQNRSSTPEGTQPKEGDKTSDSKPSDSKTPELTDLVIEGLGVIIVKQSTFLKATAKFEDGSTKDVTDLGTWSVLETDLAEISTKGAFRALKVGRGEVKVEYQGFYVKLPFEIVAEIPKLIKITGATHVAAGLTADYAASGLYSDGTERDLTTQVAWRSEKENILIMSTDNSSKGRANAKQKGTAKVVAKLHNILGDVEGSFSVEVTDAELKTLKAITPATASSPVGGDGVYFEVVGVMTDNTELDYTALVTWSSSDDSIADISNTAGKEGFARGKSKGSVVITATPKLGNASLAVQRNFDITKRMLKEVHLECDFDRPLYPGCSKTDGSNCTAEQEQSQPNLVGYSRVFSVYAYFSDCDMEIVTDTDLANVRLSVLNPSNPPVASFSSATLNFLSAGKATVSAEYKWNENFHAIPEDETVEVTVHNNTIEKIWFFQDDPTPWPPVGFEYCSAVVKPPGVNSPSGPDSFQFGLYALKTDCSFLSFDDFKDDIQWSSSDESVAKFSSETAGLLEFLKTGTINVSAKYTNANGEDIEATIKDYAVAVTEPVKNTIEAVWFAHESAAPSLPNRLNCNVGLPSTVALERGENFIQFKMYAIKTDCSILNFDDFKNQIEWSSSDESTAAFSLPQPGLLSIFKTNKLNLTAKYINANALELTATLNNFEVTYVTADCNNSSVQDANATFVFNIASEVNDFVKSFCNDKLQGWAANGGLRNDAITRTMICNLKGYQGISTVSQFNFASPADNPVVWWDQSVSKFTVKSDAIGNNYLIRKLECLGKLRYACIPDSRSIDCKQ